MKHPKHFVRLFKREFEAAIISGAKRQTVRPYPKRMPKPGDIQSARVWTGLPYRSPQKELREDVITKVAQVKITPCMITLDGFKMRPPERNWFAFNDGFKSFHEMVTWFKREHELGKRPFEGIVIYW